MMQHVAENAVLRSILLLFVFAAVGLAAYFATHRATVRHATRSRLPDGESRAQTLGSLRSQRVEGAWLKLVNSIEKSGVSLVDTNDAAVRSQLISAGFPGPHAVRIYNLLRLFLVVLLPVLALTMIWLSGMTPSVLKLYILLVPAALIGLYGPKLFVSIRADRRRQELINAFPDALDLMLVCVEAGLGLEAAFSRVGMEMMTSHPLLTEQFGTVVLELRAGRNHDEAFRRMADRAGSDEIRAFATLLIQSTRLGSSISQTLRVYAKEMREKRRMKAEERAHRLPVLISIPLVACMLPTMIGVLMLPAAIRVARTVMPTLGGG